MSESVSVLQEKQTPLLSQEGWREAPGWFPAETPLAGSASRSRCPP